MMGSVAAVQLHFSSPVDLQRRAQHFDFSFWIKHKGSVGLFTVGLKCVSVISSPVDRKTYVAVYIIPFRKSKGKSQMLATPQSSFTFFRNLTGLSRCYAFKSQNLCSTCRGLKQLNHHLVWTRLSWDFPWCPELLSPPLSARTLIPCCLLQTLCRLKRRFSSPRWP